MMDKNEVDKLINEVYEHISLLFIALMKKNPSISWRANNNSFGVSFNGSFPAGINTSDGEVITYLISCDKWELLDGSGIATSCNAPKFENCTLKDILKRLEKFIKEI